MTDERDRFLAERKEGIGGSDIAAIMGINPYKSAHQVYLEKIGDAPDEPPSPAMQRGIALEPLIADWYQRTTGRIVSTQANQYVHPDHPELRVHPDALVSDEKQGHGIAEFKAPGFRNFGAWKLEGLPQMYYLQIQWGLGIVPAGLAEFGGAAFFSAELWDGIHFDVPRNEAIITIIQERALRFWKDHVMALVPPPLETEPIVVEVPELKGTELTLMRRRDDIVWTGAANVLLEARQIALDAQAYKEAVEGKVKEIMGDDQIVEGGGVRVYYRHQAGRKSIDTKKLQAARPLDREKVIEALALNPSDLDECEIDFLEYEKISRASRPFRVYQVKP